MSENMVLRILETIQDQIKKIRTDDKNEIKNEIKNELGARIDNLSARIDHLSDRLSTADLAWRMEGAKRQGDLEDRIASLEAEIGALKAVIAGR